jgi:integrase
MNIYNELKKETDKYRAMKKLPGTPFEQEEDYNKILRFLILSLYVLIPPRRNLDFLCMWVIKDDKRSEMLNVRNYLILEEDEFIFQNYKTSKTYGLKIEKIPEELMNNIKFYLKFHPSLVGISKKPNTYKFLVNFKGEGFDQVHNVNAITRILNSVFGKNISTSILRHSFITHTLGGDIAKLETIAQNMGHSKEMQAKYVKTDKIKQTTPETSSDESIETE